MMKALRICIEADIPLPPDHKEDAFAGAEWMLGIEREVSALMDRLIERQAFNARTSAKTIVLRHRGSHEIIDDSEPLLPLEAA